MSTEKLFREESINAQAAKSYGEILLSLPLSSRIVVGVAAASACLLMAFLYFGSYTRRVTVPGQLVPVSGVAKIYVQQPGLVVEVRAAEGRSVSKGDVLFLVSGEQRTSGGDVQAAIAKQALVQKSLLQGQAKRTERLLLAEQNTIQGAIDRLTQELPGLSRQIENQSSRVELAQKSLDRFLQAGSNVSQEQVIQKQADLLDQRNSLEGLRRSYFAASQDLREARNQLSALPAKYGNQIADLQRAIAGIQQGIIENELRRETIVAAPAGGLVSAVTVHEGQWVDGATPMATINPGGQDLLAELYAPSRAVGLMKLGDEVYLRYESFPHQKYGQFRGEITQITTSALTSAELTRTNVFESGTVPKGEPLYRITVKLDIQAVPAYGILQKLRAGMLLEADVRSETRRLYEWVMDPIKSLGTVL